VFGVPVSAGGPPEIGGGPEIGTHQHRGSSTSAGGQRHLGRWEAGPRRLALRTVRLAGIPIIKLPAPLGWASPALRARAPRGPAAHGREVGLRRGGWPALAGLPTGGRPGHLRAARFGLLPNPHLLLTGPSRAGARTTPVSTLGARAVPAAEVQVVRLSALHGRALMVPHPLSRCAARTLDQPSTATR
jgi:hypothetical protein